VGAKSKAHGLMRFIEEASPRMIKLDPQQPLQGEKDRTWRVIVNTEWPCRTSNLPRYPVSCELFGEMKN